MMMSKAGLASAAKPSPAGADKVSQYKGSKSN
jgi:hypothetical protein